MYMYVVCEIVCIFMSLIVSFMEILAQQKGSYQADKGENMQTKDRHQTMSLFLAEISTLMSFYLWKSLLGSPEVNLSK